VRQDLAPDPEAIVPKPIRGGARVREISCDGDLVLPLGLPIGGLFVAILP
jgi:hypothetical protein